MSSWRSNPRLFCVCLLAWYLSGCASADSSGFDEDVSHGGQTGSLVPRCVLPGEAPYIVPEGDTAFAQQVSDPLGTTSLTSTTGASIPLVEVREGSTSILRADQVLLPGTYTLTDHCEASGRQVTLDITVVPAAPLPQEFGHLETTPPDQVPLCSELHEVIVTWTPSEAFTPYLGLTELTLYRADQPVGVIAQGEPFVSQGNSTVQFNVPLCPAVDTCIPKNGPYRVQARIAGEESTWTSATFEVAPMCRPDPVDDETGLCSMRTAGTQTVGSWWLCPLLVASWLSRRSAKRKCQ